MSKELSDRRKSARRDAGLLRAASLLRSVGQGAALACVGLLLNRLGWSGGAVGATMAAAGVLRTVLSLFVSELNAALGPKRYLLLFEAVTASAALTMALTARPAALAAAIVCAGLGVGHSGTGGPAAPIERAWLAKYAKGDLHRSMNTHAWIGYAGMGAGSLAAGLPALLSGHAAPTANAYRPLFAFVALLALASCGCLLPIRSGGQRKAAHAAASAPPAAPPPAARPTVATPPALPHLPSPASRLARLKPLLPLAGAALAIGMPLALRRLGFGGFAVYAPVAVFVAWLLARLAGRLRSRRMRAARGEAAASGEELHYWAGLLSGMTATLTGSMTSFWFSSRFEAASGWIGAVMGLSYAGAGLVSFAMARRAEPNRALTSVVALQASAAVFMLLLPWSPSFAFAAVMEIGCRACGLGTRGSRSAMMLEERGERRRSFATRLYGAFVRFLAVLWPGAFGPLIEAGHDVAPFTLAAGLQAGSAAFYAKAYRRPPQPESASARDNVRHAERSGAD